MELNKIYCGDALEVLRTFPNNCIDCCISSPPYFQQRNYNCGDKEIGRESNIHEYVSNLTLIFSEVLRVLKPTGSLYLNLGSKYKNTDLIPVPWYVAISLMEHGWHLKSDIIYHKKNPMPGSYKSRPISSHEYVFLMTKETHGHYYDWEAISLPPSGSYANDKRAPGILRNKFYDNSKYTQVDCDTTIANQFKKQDGVNRSDYIGFNARYKSVEKVRRRDVWSLTVKGSALKHFAMFNPNLVEICVKAGCPETGVILDPFFGSGVLGEVALNLNRNYIGIELNPEYVDIANQRLNPNI
jgi:site-specific DNA-methyltransferase (adenine-specific)